MLNKYRKLSNLTFMNTSFAYNISCYLVIFFFIITAQISGADIILLNDGTQYIGKVTESTDQLTIATPYQEITVAKESINKIYKDLQEVNSEIIELMAATQAAIADAGKIQNIHERNTLILRQIESLTKRQKTYSRIIGFLTTADSAPIKEKFNELNATIEHVRSLVVTEETEPDIEETTEPAGPDVEARKKIEKAREFFAMGSNALAQMQYDKAKEYFIVSLSYDAEFPETYVKLGDVHTILKDEEIGYLNYQMGLEAIIRQGSMTAEMVKLRDDILKKVEKFRIIKHKIYGIDSEFNEGLIKLGNKSATDKNYILANDVFSTVLSIEPNNTDALNGIEAIRGNLDKLSIKDLTVDESKEANAYYQDGLLLFWKNDCEKAMIKFKEALAINPQLPGALLKAGECSEKKGDNFEAIHYYWLCLKSIQKMATTTKELEEQRARAAGLIEKIDDNARELGKLKNNYTGKLHALAYDCMKKKYNRFAYHILEKVIAIDIGIKSVNESFAQLKETVIITEDTKKYFSASNEDVAKINISAAGFSIFEEIGFNLDGCKEYKHYQTGMVFVLIPSGAFTMGRSDTDNDEKPAHKVTVKEFLLSKFEVTQGVWQKIMGGNPSTVTVGADYPVDSITWEDCALFASRVGLRLPTEAEWEYACNGNNTSRFSFGNDAPMLDEYAWHFSNSGGKLQPVGKKKSTLFGLYDMYGNVAEWCQDWYSENYYRESIVDNPPGPKNGVLRAVRGGSWYYLPEDIYSARRARFDPAKPSVGIGLRCAADFK